MAPPPWLLVPRRGAPLRDIGLTTPTRKPSMTNEQHAPMPIGGSLRGGLAMGMVRVVGPWETLPFERGPPSDNAHP
eukprot:5143590-Pyramimonas_sp.AAC.1